MKDIIDEFTHVLNHPEKYTHHKQVNILAGKKRYDLYPIYRTDKGYLRVAISKSMERAADYVKDSQNSLKDKLDGYSANRNNDELNRICVDHTRELNDITNRFITYSKLALGRIKQLGIEIGGEMVSDSIKDIHGQSLFNRLKK